jgi:hypothetical protein
MKHDEQPPRLLLALFRWLCHPDFREEIEGDLLEKYHADLQRHGLKAARRQFVVEEFSIARFHLIFNLNRNEMTTKNWLGLLAVAVIIMLASIAPLLPGTFHFVFYLISKSLQGMGYLSLAFVPFGLIWLILELRNQKDRKLDRWTNGYYPSLLALTPILVVLAVQLYGAIKYDFWNSLDWFSLVFVELAILAFCLYRIQKLRQKTDYQFNPTPLYLTLIPLFALFNVEFVVEKAATYSREKTIEQSQPLITAIEKYKSEKGEYPLKLEDLEEAALAVIPKPGSKGISAFFYEKTNDAYLLQIEKSWHWNATEVLVYSQTGQAGMKNKYESFATSHANWRYHLAD